MAADPTVVGPSILVPLATAARAAEALAQAERLARRDGLRLSPDVAELVRLFDAARRARTAQALAGSADVPQRFRSLTEPVPPVEGAGTTTPGRVTVSSAAAELGVTTRAIRKRLASGSLRGVKDRQGHWMVDRESIEEHRR